MIDMSRMVVTSCMALGVLLTMSGCATAADASEQRAIPVGRYSTLEAAVPLAPLGSDYYLETIRGLLSGVPHVDQPDADLIQGGKDLCAEMDAGATWDTFALQVDDIGGDRAFYRVVVRAAVMSFCPAHITAL